MCHVGTGGLVYLVLLSYYDNFIDSRSLDEVGNGNAVCLLVMRVMYYEVLDY